MVFNTSRTRVGRSFEKRIRKIKEVSREGHLKKEIIDKVIDDIPEIHSTDLIEILREVQNIEE